MTNRGYNRYSRLGAGDNTELELHSVEDSDASVMSIMWLTQQGTAEITNGSIMNFFVYDGQRWVLNYSAIAVITSVEQIVAALHGPDGLPTIFDQESYDQIVRPLSDGKPKDLRRLFVMESYGTLASICSGAAPIATIIPIEANLKAYTGIVTVRPLRVALSQITTDTIIRNYLGHQYAPGILGQLVQACTTVSDDKTHRRVASAFRSDFVTIILTKYGILSSDTNVADTDPEWYDSASEQDKIFEYTASEVVLKSPWIRRCDVS
ncbi:MAG: hypothetical protein LBR78_03415 [Holosporales bacterium]|nr:hypothetical protein [Holosporales bacterium]